MKSPLKILSIFLSFFFLFITSINGFAQEPPVQPVEKKFSINFVNNKLTVDLEDADLLDVLLEIAAVKGFRVAKRKNDYYGTVTKKFIDLEYEKGLSKILKGKNYMFLYTDDDNNNPVETLMLLPNNNGKIQASAQREAIIPVQTKKKPPINNPFAQAAQTPPPKPKPKKPITAKQKAEDAKRLNAFEQAILKSIANEKKNK